MKTECRSILDDLDDTSLFRMIGRAWYAQADNGRTSDPDNDVSAAVGRREFEIVEPVLAEALRQPFDNGVLARITSTLQVEATWTMPGSVVAALARRRGLVRRGLLDDVTS